MSAAPEPRFRGALLESLAARAAGSPILLAGPPGAGKTTLLLRLAARLEADGWAPIYLDLMGAASTPERFVAAAARTLPRAVAHPLQAVAERGREHGEEGVLALFEAWRKLDRASGRRVCLLLDEATEIRSLAYFPGLREAHAALGTALAARPAGTVLATSFPTLARRLWPGWPAASLGPLAPEDAAPLGAEGEALRRAGFGWPRYVRVLHERVARGASVRDAWCEAMEHGGALEVPCRGTYESLLLRSRGYGVAKAVLAAVADEEGLNLTSLVPRLGRTPGATRDYLTWLVAVDALQMTRKRYGFVDAMLAAWVRLHARGTPPSSSAIGAEADAALHGPPPAAPPPPEEAVAPARTERARDDRLMEID